MPVEVIAAQISPYAVEFEAGLTYKWCRCGRSRTQPFCDESHAGTGSSRSRSWPSERRPSFSAAARRPEARLSAMGRTTCSEAWTGPAQKG